jgi:hypothetical protein
LATARPLGVAGETDVTGCDPVADSAAVAVDRGLPAEVEAAAAGVAVVVLVVDALAVLAT